MTDLEMTAEQMTSMRWRIPLAIVMGALMQLVAVIWWASTVESRLSLLTAQETEHRARLDASDLIRVTSGERIARVEQISQDILESLRRIDTKLDHIKPER
jgi:hypothetical protein